MARRHESITTLHLGDLDGEHEKNQIYIFCFKHYYLIFPAFLFHFQGRLCDLLMVLCMGKVLLYITMRVVKMACLRAYRSKYFLMCNTLVILLKKMISCTIDSPLFCIISTSLMLIPLLLVVLVADYRYIITCFIDPTISGHSRSEVLHHFPVFVEFFIHVSV